MDDCLVNSGPNLRTQQLFLMAVYRLKKKTHENTEEENILCIGVHICSRNECKEIIRHKNHGYFSSESVFSDVCDVCLSANRVRAKTVLNWHLV